MSGFRAYEEVKKGLEDADNQVIGSDTGLDRNRKDAYQDAKDAVNLNRNSMGIPNLTQHSQAYQTVYQMVADDAKNGGELSFNGAMNVNNKKIDIHNQSSFYQ